MSEKPDAGRSDYTQFAHFTQLKPGEPYFLIRASDENAGDGVRGWAALTYAKGGPPALVEQALQQADALDAWPTKKLPDVAHLKPEQIQQLQYELSRRAWDARADSGDPRVMLAEERAYSAAMSRLRPTLAALFEGGELDPATGVFTWTPPRDEHGILIERPSPIEALRRLAIVVRSDAEHVGA